mmetsp:Transcript_643/g.1281  ORF Transcript_643/g.1281 Transcript_643/m.1281 type:complete len:98 (+) Transcript_643:706-999(+)
MYWLYAATTPLQKSDMDPDSSRTKIVCCPYPPIILELSETMAPVGTIGIRVTPCSATLSGWDWKCIDSSSSVLAVAPGLKEQKNRSISFDTILVTAL